MKRFERTLLVFVIFSFLLSLLGCTMYGVAKVSEPVLSDADAAQVKLENDILVYRDLTVSIKPQNYYVSFVSIGPVVPIVPFPTVGEPPVKRKGKNLMLVVQMETNNEGLRFAPKDVVIQYKNNIYKPTTARGPYSGGGHAREVARAVPGHKWECFRPKGELITGLGTREVNGKVCFEIEFQLTTLQPEEEFRVTLGGIERNGEALYAPTVLFRPASRGGLTLMM